MRTWWSWIIEGVIVLCCILTAYAVINFFIWAFKRLVLFKIKVWRSKRKSKKMYEKYQKSINSRQKDYTDEYVAKLKERWYKTYKGDEKKDG